MVTGDKYCAMLCVGYDPRQRADYNTLHDRDVRYMTCISPGPTICLLGLLLTCVIVDIVVVEECVVCTCEREQGMRAFDIVAHPLKLLAATFCKMGSLPHTLKIRGSTFAKGQLAPNSLATAPLAGPAKPSPAVS